MIKIFNLVKFILNTILLRLKTLGEVIKYSLKVKKYLKENPQHHLSRNQKKEIRSFYAGYGFKIFNSDWHRFYSGVYGEYSPSFIPNTLFYATIEKTLNRDEFTVLQDKNLLDRIFKNVEQPFSIIKNINGYFFHKDELVSSENAVAELNKYDRFIIKPSIDSGGGKNVKLVELTSKDNSRKILDFFIEYKKDYLIQEVLQQSKTMASLNPTSINTIRIVTYLRPNEVVVLSAMLRIGVEGSVTDNVSAGGISVNILAKGLLDKNAHNGFKRIVSKKVEDRPLNSFKIPNYSGVVEKAKILHKQVPYFKNISWDFALNQNNVPILIEYNVFGQGIDQQAQCGPWFGEYTKEILEFIQKTK